MAQTFDLPVDVPWQLVAASPDMMDTGFCGGKFPAFPPAWRSSLAIYAYEPSPDDLPPQMCNQKITYLKVTCSITGYQPTAEETSQLVEAGADPTSPYTNLEPAHATFPDTQGSAQSPYRPPVAVDEFPLPWGDFTDAYFACYGVLLNVAVFPSTTTVPSTTTAADTFHFTQRSAPNPFTTGALTFTLTPGGAELPVVQTISGAYGILIGNAQLQIDLPLSRNVSITMALAKLGLPKKGRLGQQPHGGTITAYLGTQVVFAAPFIAQELTDSPHVVTDITTSSPVTRVVIQSNDASYLMALSYSDVERPTTLGDYPHIIDFEPKTRDLYQAATDQSELLTGSNSGVSTGKSMSNTSSSEMGLGLSGGYNAGGVNISGQLTGKWGNTSTDSSSLQIDSSRQSRETQGTTTNITQQYNLLTGYHAGTNRAAFLMLPRPHTLQATDYRTFVRGLRMIEGLQDFFLIVSRPIILPGICIEASLETGHFPEDVTTQAPPAPALQKNVYVSGQSVNVPGSGDPFGGTRATPTPFSVSLPNTWNVDTTQTTPPATPLPQGTDPKFTAWTYLAPGVFYVYGPISGQTTNTDTYKQAAKYISIASGPSTDSGVTGTILVTPGGFGSWGNPGGTSAIIQVWIAVCETQAPQPVAQPVDEEPAVVVSDFLVTSRELCVCLNSCPTNNCVMIAPPVQVPYSQSPGLATALSSGSGSSSTTSTIATGESTVLAANVSSPALPRSALRAANVAQSATSTAPSSAAASGALTVASAGAAPASQPDRHGSSARSSIVYETQLKLPRSVLHPNQLQKSRTPAARETMHQIQHHLLNSWRMPQRRAHGAVGFLESDYLASRLRKRLPKHYLSHRITEVKGLSTKIVRALGTHTTIGDVLKVDLHRLRVLAKVDVEGATRIRRLILGFEKSEDSAAENEIPGSAKRIAKAAAPQGRAKTKTKRK